MATHVLALTSDQHAGSTVGLCPPDPIPLDDGGAYQPSKVQGWLWDAWVGFWREVERTREAESAELTWINNGDAVEGIHHGTPQVPSNLSLTHAAIFHECASVPLALKPERILAIRGTEAHVGPSGQTEEGIWKGVRAEGYNVLPDPERNTATWWQFRGKIGGVYFDVTHHGRMGQRAHTRDGYLRHYAHDIWTDHLMDGHQPPDVAIRSHYHMFGDSGPPMRRGTRVVALPCFQLATSYIYRRHADSLPDIGGVILVVRNGEVDVRKVLKRPTRAPVMEVV